MLRRYPGSDFVTGLRAYAALMVLIIHTGALREFGKLGANVTDAGKYGVAMFFVISGFSVTASYFKSKNYAGYLVQRIARIWPMYAIALAAGGLFSVHLDLYNIFMHLSFLSFLDYRIANNILGVEWSIPIEVSWYLLLPLVLLRWYNYRDLVIGCVALLICGAALRLLLHFTIGKGGGLAAHYMPVRHGAFFLLGVIAYKLRKEGGLLDDRISALIATGALLLIPLVMASGLRLSGEAIALAAAALIAFYRDSAVLPRTALSNKVVLFLGTISYSFYLLHVLVLGLATTSMAAFVPKSGLTTFVSVALMTAALSTATYLLIERPINWFGRLLASRLNERRGDVHGVKTQGAPP